LDSHFAEALLEGVIRSFLSYLRVEKGVSMNTHDAYRRDVEKFQEFAAKKHLRLEQATRETIVDFLRSLYQRKLESRSVARNLVTLRQFFRFALIEGIVKEDPTETVESPRFRMGLPRFLSVEEVDRLLAAPDAGTTIGLRDKAMIEVMYSAGLRV
jgi:integrase/recombinase XerD